MTAFFEILKNTFDIFALAAILFFIYRFAVKRRAVRLVMGVVLFLLVMLIVDATKLTALGFVFGDFRQLGVIAILIIFQPELRSALEKIGATTFEGIHGINPSSSKNDVGTKDIVEPIAHAAQMLSDIKYGALIVVEREDRLDDHMQSASMLDSKVTTDALNSIFYKGGALHDGAVVIRHGRIECARCVLPLTKKVDLPSELGTRHRAALGVSEQYDSVVVVVSEETGTISISVNGELERGFTYTTLRKRLLELLDPTSEKKENENIIHKIGRKGKAKAKSVASGAKKASESLKSKSAEESDANKADKS